MVNSESESADVECFASETDTQPINMPGCEYTVRLKSTLDKVDIFFPVSTDTYRAQYHVLEAFSLFNVILGTFKVFFTHTHG